MTAPVKLSFVFGTRPEAIKLAPIIIAARRRPDDFEVEVISTGQHREMLDQMLQWFRIDTTVDLEVMRSDQTITHITTAVIDGVGGHFQRSRPDWVFVHGDTTTTFAGALAAFYHRLPVAHVEAGLRTGDIYSPYPEEMNRLLTTRLTSLHLAPTPAARANLLHEGVADAHIVVTGNPGIDALLLTLERCGGVSMLRPDQPNLLVTTHRRENHGEPMRDICGAVLDLLQRYPSLTVTLPLHLSPTVRRNVMPILGGHPRVTLCEPLSYPDFVVAMARSTLILSDSGGVQEEAPSLGKPVLVLREMTERPEAVDSGAAILVGPHREAIVSAAVALLDDPVAYQRMASVANPFGDGTAAAQILAAVLARH
jgi:UDP-N-acetylglucosamine 2-epimerase (non-hydrolysing)